MAAEVRKRCSGTGRTNLEAWGAAPWNDVVERPGAWEGEVEVIRSIGTVMDCTSGEDGSGGFQVDDFLKQNLT